MEANHKMVVIGGSAGSLAGVFSILRNLPTDFHLPIVLCLHRLRGMKNGLKEILSERSAKGVLEPYDKEKVSDGKVYLAPANYHLSIESDKRFSLATEEPVNSSRPSIDITMDALSDVFQNRLIGILLSGANRDGALGMRNIKKRGGLTIVQRPEECRVDTMPTAAMKLTRIDHVLNINEIQQFLNKKQDVYSRVYTHY